MGERYRMLHYTPCLAGYVYIHVSSKCMATDFLMQTFDLHFYAINAQFVISAHAQQTKGAVLRRMLNEPVVEVRGSTPQNARGWSESVLYSNMCSLL